MSHSDNMLILWDQHAVHERIRLEKLIKENYSTEGGDSKTAISEITILDSQHGSLLSHHTDVALRWGLRLKIDNSAGVVLVTESPKCFLQSNDIGSQCETLAKELVQRLLQREPTSGIPKTILSFLATRACHGAIRFGDALSHEDRQQLLDDLANCNSPFQCAHGRPSLVPLMYVEEHDNHLSNKVPY